jgi:hypothetical protein
MHPFADAQGQALNLAPWSIIGMVFSSGFGITACKDMLRVVTAEVSGEGWMGLWGYGFMRSCLQGGRKWGSDATKGTVFPYLPNLSPLFFTFHVFNVTHDP